MSNGGAVDAETAEAEEEGEAAGGLDLSLGKKKKKRKPKARTDEEFGAAAEDGAAAGDAAAGGEGAEKENEDDGLPAVPKLPWDGSDRDYSYQELLGTLASLLPPGPSLGTLTPTCMLCCMHWLRSG